MSDCERKTSSSITSINFSFKKEKSDAIPKEEDKKVIVVGLDHENQVDRYFYDISHSKSGALGFKEITYLSDPSPSFSVLASKHTLFDELHTPNHEKLAI